MQGKAEDKLRKEKPDLYPPQMADHIKEAVAKWMEQKKANGWTCCFCCRQRPDEVSFLELLRIEMEKFKEKHQEVAAKGLLPGANALTGCDGIAATARYNV